MKILFVVPSGEEGSHEESSVYYAEYYLVEVTSEKDADLAVELFSRYGRDNSRIVEELRQCTCISAFELLSGAVKIV